MDKKKRFSHLSKSPSESGQYQESWQVFQIMAELVQGFEHLSQVPPSVSIFGSARIHPEHPCYSMAEHIAYELSMAGFSIVTGGGPGIMEAANKGGLRGTSPSIGLNITLPHEQKANQYQNISLNFRHFFTRKLMLTRYASAHIFLPGGLGTLDELTEVLVLTQNEKMPRVPIILVQSHFWQGLLNWLRDSLLANQTIHADDLNLVTIVDDAQQVLDSIFLYYEKPEVGFTLS